ncbi:BA14K family protein [Chelativorans sp. AA-79]|uniref:BA14K family protein n=1 Tax=Chelativorans sp. AA-79 TaxID=3028735 RepID=UPI0023F71D7E|nr:BA14K family protein [Chelativorans sp. AA-79]WEX11400.1 BA14K family protein [Chelativorans sp. AA-79]
MKRALTTLAFCAFAALGLSATAPAAQAAALSAGAAANAAPVTTAQPADLVQVDHRDRRHWRRGHDRRHWRHHRNWDRRHHWRRAPRSGFTLEFGTGGYRYGPPPYYARPRYVVPRRAYGLPAAHVNWCHAKYRSYRASDNSFQPYHGPRRACISPYWR